MNASFLSPAEAALLLGANPTAPRITKARSGELVLGIRELTEEDLVLVEGRSSKEISSLSEGAFGVPSLLKVRQSHHRMAQLLALGMKDVDVARMTGYGVPRISVLKTDPSFRELLTFYASEVESGWAEFTQIAADLSIDAMTVLRERMEDDPDAFSPSMLLEITKTLADRTGNAPVTKSVSVNVTQDMGSRMLAAERREREARMPNV